ncbi:hypothetical protein KGQ19_17295, partial [Catenulispora sp. NL8]|nr:hypothetical protein [Catenulispora pinistramenti]
MCFSAAGFRVHNPAPPQASSTPASQDKGTGQIKSKIKGTGKINSKIKVKPMVKGRASGGPRQPQGN